MSDDTPTTKMPTVTELERLFSLSLDMLCIATLEGYFASISPSFIDTLGWSEEELKSKPFLEFVHPDDADATVAEVASLAENQTTVYFENRYRCADGSYKWLAWRAVPFLEEGTIYARARDVTARKQAELEQQRLVRIMELSPDLVASADPSGTILYINCAGRELLGAGPGDEIIGKKVADFYTPEAFAEIQANVLPEALANGSAYGETRLLQADGNELPVSLGLIVHRGPDGKVAQLSTVMRDISDLKAVDQLKSEFVSTVSHELRTPLTSVRGSIGLLLGGVAGDLPPKATELLDIARSNAERLIRLVNDILDLERIEAGKIEFRREKIPMPQLVANAAESVAGLAKPTNVHVEVERAANVAVEADADRLMQVLTNLLGNAIKFSPPGGSVFLAVDSDGSSVRATVRDEGPGIGPEDLQRVFGRFEQLEGGDARKTGGSGLGLAIAKAIVEELGGTIGVDSELGEGSTFWFELPLRPDTVETPIVAAPEGIGRRVLLVEDDAELATIVSTMVEREGYVVDHVSTLAEANAALDVGGIAAVLLDVLLPDGNGLELLDRISDWPTEEQLPVIVISGSAEPRHYGVPVLLEWLVKPFDESRLISILNRATGREVAPRVLVVEDDDDSRRLIAAQLEQLGCECVLANDGAAALRHATTSDLDLIVLDVGLPVLDGFEFVDLLKRRGEVAVPLIVHTGRDLSAAERDRLRLGMTRHLTKLRADEHEFLGAVRELLSGVRAPPDAAAAN